MKIAVICAVNINHNPGMVTVDRAAKEFFAGRGLDIEWLIAGFVEDQNPGVEDLSGFTSVFDEAGFPEKYDRIVFWGDFLQSRIHHATLAQILMNRGRAKDGEQARSIIRKHLLLQGAPEETLRKTAIVGSSIHADSAEILIDFEYQKALSRLLLNARSVRMREPLSSYRATMLSGRDGTVGMDAAFLSIRRHSWNNTAKNNRKDGPLRIAIVGGRSDHRHGRKLKFAALTTLKEFQRRRKKATLEVLPWLAGSLGRWGSRAVKTPSHIRDPNYCLERLAECDALVTDVYHAAINALVLGIPVALLGIGAEFDTTPIQSKKKELLFLSLFAGQNYVYFEDISYWRPRKFGNKIVGILTNEENNREIFGQRKRDAEWFWKTLEIEIDLPKQTTALIELKP